jgi:endogenous inhibitor of DNA gyrase (YacG/DUF329 family)
MAKSSDVNSVRPVPRAGRKCPICGKPVTARHQPFCSPRCADIDLGRWLKEAYSIPTDEGAEEGPRDDEP